jgi:hypothetical protein
VLDPRGFYPIVQFALLGIVERAVAVAAPEVDIAPILPVSVMTKRHRPVDHQQIAAVPFAFRRIAAVPLPVRDQVLAGCQR